MQNHIITCSLDGTIKVWNAIEPASPGAVLDINAAYVFPPEEPGKPVHSRPLVAVLTAAPWKAERLVSHKHPSAPLAVSSLM